MNPPFSNGDEHLLKAWDILHEGHIVCLLNEQTILNPHTNRRKLLKTIIDQHGSVEYLGDCFTEADRPTDCRIAMVRLEKKEKSAKFDFKFDTTDERKFDFTEEVAADNIALNDLTGAMLRQYERTKDAYVNYIKARNELAFYGGGLTDGSESVGKMAEENYTGNISESYNGFIDSFKASAWSRIINKLGMGKFLTNRVMQDFNKFKKTQGAMDLTRENIYALINMLFENRVNILDTAVVDVFDLFTKYHSDNRCHVEGWKTNTAWKVNQKIILPYYVSYGSYCSTSSLKQFGDRFSISSKHGEFSDIDKVMCYLTGTDYNECYTLYEALQRKFQALGSVRTGDVFDNTGESQFFTFKFWKKGTLHITFKDPKVWEEFNFRACKGKNWLPAEEEKAYRQKKAKEKAKTEPATPAADQFAGYTNVDQILLASPNPINSHEEEQTNQDPAPETATFYTGGTTTQPADLRPAAVTIAICSPGKEPEPAEQPATDIGTTTAIDMKKETIVVLRKGKSTASEIRAEIKLLKNDSGKWAVGYDITTPLDGSGFAPDPAKADYNTKDQAITAGIALLTKKTEAYRQRENDNCAPYYQLIHDATMSYQRQQKQLSIF
jgi:hypothetical protein